MSFLILIAVIGTVNLCLGAALAAYIHRPPHQRQLATAVVRRAVSATVPKPDTQPVVEVPEPDLAPVAPAEEGAPSEEIPEQWLSVLEEARETTTFVEAAIHVFRLEIGRYRDELIAVDRRVRQCATNPSDKLIRECLHELKQSNQSYLGRQGDALTHLANRQSNLGALADVGSELEGVLMEQSAQIETTVSNIDVLDFDSDVEVGCKRLIQEIGRLLNSCHRVRDAMQESMLAVLKAEGRLDTAERKLQMDALTGLLNRVGLEKLFHEWLNAGTDRLRTISLAMIDIDHFGMVNENLGALVCDALLRAFGDLLSQLMRKDRGFDVVARFAGQRFVLYLGDTGPRAATSVVERIRQTVSESSFVVDDIELTLNFSAGVSEVRGDDTTASVFKRLTNAMRRAKRSGRNSTCIADENGVELVKPPEFQVRPRVIRVPP